MALGFQEDDDAETEKDAFLTIENHKRIIFHLNDRVEVFSEEEGFQGSWHPGTVILIDRNGWKLSYHVKYDHLLADDGSEQLIGCLHVSELVDDDDCATHGRIRPLEDRLQSSLWNLCYGRCVDVHYNEGWWEGVVFDHEDGSKHRDIFFPELGDEMMFHVDRIRISRDWNNITGAWQIRETWLFLELIEEHEKEHYVPVSIKQLWYDLREKEKFKKLGEWTSKEKDLWKNLVLEAIDDNLKILIHHVLQEIGLPESAKAPAFCHDANNYAESDMPQKDIILQEEDIPSSYNFCSDSPTNCCFYERSIVQQLEPPSRNGMSRMNLLAQSNLSCHGKPALEMPLVLLASPIGKDETSVTTSSINAHLTFGSDAYRNYSTSVCKESTYLPVGADVVPGPGFFPDVIRKYAQMGKKRPHESVLVNCRKHLLFLNWKVECARGSFNRFRYTSPDGKQYYSLREVCAVLTETHKDIISLGDQDENANLSNCPSNSPKNPDSEVSFHSDVHVVEPEYCPEAVLDWYKCGSEGKRKRENKKDANQMIMKAKKHLAVMGWIFRYVYSRGRRELRYISPSGRRYNSLRAACGDPTSRIASVSGACTSVRPERKADSKTVEGQSNLSEEELLKLEYCSNQYARMSKFRNLGMLQKIEVGRIRKSEKKRKNILESSFIRQKSNSVSQNFPAKRRSKSKDLIRGQNKTKGACPNIVLRSSKRVKHLVEPNPSHRKPRTILSWLIDNTDVLPRAKLTYCASNGGSPVAEGRISGGGSGIKCNCCGKLYSLSGFEFHAIGQYGRLAGSILSDLLLEDGRSLLDCQMQVIHTNKRNFRKKPLKKLPGRRHQGENDHVCSVCHYGGDLILCDQCPSSFHHSCLGMTDVPDGDWFCSSCCCNICGQNKLKRDSKHSMDDYGVLNCTQCERKYHIGCLRTKGEESLEYFSEGDWFCSKTCEEICVALHELSGKPVPVHLNNLTWTMLKCTEFKNHNHDASDTEAMCGNYCHLRIALDVMHECFDPIEEPYTKKDLLKDVIFSKRSELKRLNFRGFYTVLLQKGDEVITVATVRIYGEKVAEIPLIGTRFQYRRRGMCRILLNVLEKKLGELGIQRLLLPAVPSLLNTWTDSFGFSKLSDSGRLQLLDYTFLVFQDTIMCEKLLMKIPSAESSPSKEIQLRLENDAIGYGDNIDGLSTVSEVFQACQIGSDIVEYGRFEDFAINNTRGSEGPPCNQVDRGTDMDCVPHAGEISLESLVEDPSSKKEKKENSSDGSNIVNMESRYGSHQELKFYKRRRVLVGFGS